jgi:predicted Zn-dependent protease
MRSISALLLLLALTGCGANAETGRRQFIIVSDSQMNALGADAYGEMLASTPVSKDAALTAKITAIGKRIAAASGADFDWEFTLFDSDEVNAFCLPGGKIGVYTGILSVAETNAGLAAVLGHEVAHAVLRHGAERVSQSLALAGANYALSEALADDAQKPYIMGAIGLGAQYGVMLPYSRKHESEADLVGLKYMAAAGYDPAEAVKLWQRMAVLGGSPPEVLSTHPDPEGRAKALRDALDDVASLYRDSEKIPTQPLL